MQSKRGKVGYLYALPRMDECINSRGEVQIFSRVDVNFEYRQVKFDERDKSKTASKSPHEHFQFLKIPFHLKKRSASISASDGYHIIVSKKTLRFDVPRQSRIRFGEGEQQH